MKRLPLVDHLHAAIQGRGPLTMPEVANLAGVPMRLAQDLVTMLRTQGRIHVLPRIGQTGGFRYEVPAPLPALPAIDLQPVPLLTVSLGVVCVPTRIAA